MVDSTGNSVHTTMAAEFRAASQLTICIPTLERPAFVQIVLKHYRDFPGQILIGDGSFKPQNFIDQANVTYWHWPELTQAQTFARLANSVTTRYAVYHGDDDFIDVQAAGQCAMELDARPDLIACHGTGRAVLIGRGEDIGPYPMPVTSDGLPMARVLTAMKEYGVNLFSVHRTNAWKTMWELSQGIPDKSIGCEIMPCLVSAALGKTAQIDVPYLTRQIHAGIYHLPTGQDWMKSNDFAISIRRMIQRMAKLIAPNDQANCREQLAMGFMAYLGRSCALV